MKTLITIRDSALKKTILNRAFFDKLEKVSAVDWVPEEGEAFSRDDLKDIIGGYDFCISGWGAPRLTKDILQAAGKLKLIGHTAGTVVPYVDEYAFGAGIRVANANPALACSTAELAVALMLAGAWRLHGYNRRMRSGGWSDNSRETVPGLYGQTIGLIGYGDISREVIRLLRPFRPRLLLCSAHCTPDEARALGAELCSPEALLRQSRIVSLHNTLTGRTKGMIGRRELSWMPDGALFVNTARAPITDTKALVEETASGRLCAAIDVFDEEPFSPPHPLFDLDNVTLTPHIGGFGSHWKTRLGEAVADDLHRFLSGEQMEGEIDLCKYRRLTPR